MDLSNVSPIYRHNLIVPASSLDENGHVNNLEYLRWLLDAAALHAWNRGVTEAMKAAGAAWVVRRHRIEYFHPAFAGEHLLILTWVSTVRRVQSLRKYKIFRREDNKLLVAAETDWVFLDFQSGKLRSIPQDVRIAFPVLPEEQEAAALKKCIVEQKQAN